MLNKVIFIGRLTKDPELRKTNSDVSFANFSLSVDNPIKNSDGTRGTLFIDGRVYNVQAENLVKYCRKGSKVAVEGSLMQRNYERTDGTKGKAIEIMTDSIDYLDPKKSEEPKFDDVNSDKELDINDLPEDDLPLKAEEAEPRKKAKKSKKTSKKGGK